MAESSAQKTEKPTPKKLSDGRRRGQIARSTDLVGWLVVLVSTFVLPLLVTGLNRVLGDWFRLMAEAVEAGEAEAFIAGSEQVVIAASLVIFPFLALMTVVTVLGMVVQGGVTLSGEAMKPKLNRLSPIAGVKRLFSAQSVLDTFKAIIRLVVLALLVANVTTELMESYMTGTNRDLAKVGPELASSILMVVRLAAFAGLVVGFADYAYQRRKTGKELMMSREEIKQESRSSEGDPMVKGRRRSLHAKLSRNQMLAAVGDASVVVVNPTHVAVALSYQAGTVPTVVAKGGDALALRIRERAFEAGVPVVEVRPLARVLFDTLDVGAEIPAPMYEAVAIVIAFVMRSPRNTFDRLVRKVNVPASKVVAPEQGDGRHTGGARASAA